MRSASQWPQCVQLCCYVFGFGMCDWDRHPQVFWFSHVRSADYNHGKVQVEPIRKAFMKESVK